MNENPIPFGNYELLRPISKGGMGEVYLAKIRGPYSFEKLFVLKLMKKEFSDDPADVQRFAREACVAAKLNHQNLVQVFDFGSVRGRYFISMEYVDGFNLTRFMNGLLSQRLLLPFHLCAYIVAEMCRATHYMHERNAEDGSNMGLVHRDISPENILISQEGEVKLSDFGLVNFEGAEKLTRTGKVRGKLSYMAPERIIGRGAEASSDQYSLGMVLHELLLGKRYFPSTMEARLVQKHLINKGVDEPQKLRPDVPEELNAITSQAVSLEKRDRHKSLYEMEKVLRNYVFHHANPEPPAHELAKIMRQIQTEKPSAGFTMDRTLTFRSVSGEPGTPAMVSSQVSQSIIPETPSLLRQVLSLPHRILRLIAHRLSLTP